MTSTNYAIIIIVFNSHIDALIPPWTFPKDLNNEQIMMMLNNHPILMGADYHNDIGRLKGMISDQVHGLTLTNDHNKFILTTEANLSGKELLSLDKESLEQFGISTGFQTSIMKIIVDLVCTNECIFIVTFEHDI